MNTSIGDGTTDQTDHCLTGYALTLLNLASAGRLGLCKSPLKFTNKWGLSKHLRERLAFSILA
jgi:hypothetical protein